MKLLIVDDEPVIRESLCQIISQSFLPVSQVLSTSDPSEALILLKQEQPELLLTDIQMPLITGLDLARFVSENQLSCKVIFITGYSDFAYARAGIQYQVSDYLLKPLDEDEAMDCIGRVIKAIQQEQKQADRYKLLQQYFSTHADTVRRQFLERLLFYPLTYTGQELSLRRKELQLDFPGFVLGALTVLTTPGSIAEASCYLSMAEQHLEQNYDFLYTIPSGDILYLLWPLSPDESVSVPAKRMKEELHSQYLITVYLGFAPYSTDFQPMQLLQRQAKQCMEYARTRSLEEIIFYEDLTTTVPGQPEFDLSYLISDLIGFIKIGDRKNAQQLLFPLFQYLNEQEEASVQNTLQLITAHILYFVNSLSLPPGELSRIQNTAESHVKAQSSTTIMTEYFEYWIGFICDSMLSLQAGDQNSLIEAVYEYINRYFAEPIGLTNVSEFINRNPSYVSRLIKQVTDKNFSQILTEKRMEEAKKLLRDPSLKLADIAARTGYPNLRYFTRVFHAQVNMAPNDYRKIITTFQ